MARAAQRSAGARVRGEHAAALEAGRGDRALDAREVQNRGGSEHARRERFAASYGYSVRRIGRRRRRRQGLARAAAAASGEAVHQPLAFVRAFGRESGGYRRSRSATIKRRRLRARASARARAYARRGRRGSRRLRAPRAFQEAVQPCARGDRQARARVRARRVRRVRAGAGVAPPAGDRVPLDVPRAD